MTKPNIIVTLYILLPETDYMPLPPRPVERPDSCTLRSKTHFAPNRGRYILSLDIVNHDRLSPSNLCFCTKQRVIVFDEIHLGCKLI